MSVIINASRNVYEIPGIQHQTLAASSDGLETLELWMQTLSPGAQTPVHYHECEEVVVIQRGSGRAVIGGEGVDFEAGTTLAIPPKVIHQITNTGEEEMILIAASSETPARVFTPEGELMALPWQAEAD